MENFIIRKITISDLEALKKVGKETFQETFAETNSEEDMKNYLEESFADEVLLKELNNENSEFYFAEIEGVVAGYLKLNFGNAQTELQDNDAMELQRIYVKQDFQGRKLGQKLYQKALQRAEEKEKKYIWLGVWEHNLKAIRFYEKNGFEVFDKHIFLLGNDEQTDLMMKKRLI